MEKSTRINLLIVTAIINLINARNICQDGTLPLEIGKWNSKYKHLDSAIVDNKPVSLLDGQLYLYKNDFPEYIITYINVANLAVNSCGAKASLIAGGLGKSFIMFQLYAGPHQEMRVVIEIWGMRTAKRTNMDVLSDSSVNIEYLKPVEKSSRRAINHNASFKSNKTQIYYSIL